MTPLIQLFVFSGGLVRILNQSKNPNNSRIKKIKILPNSKN